MVHNLKYTALTPQTSSLSFLFEVRFIYSLKYRFNSADCVRMCGALDSKLLRIRICKLLHNAKQHPTFAPPFPTILRLLTHAHITCTSQNFLETELVLPLLAPMSASYSLQNTEKYVCTSFGQQINHFNYADVIIRDSSPCGLGKAHTNTHTSFYVLTHTHFHWCCVHVT